SGSATISHLRFGKNKIQECYLLDNSDLVAVHNQTYVHKYNILHGIKENGTLLLNTNWNMEQLEVMLPNNLKKEIANKHIAFYTIDADKIADELGLGNKINLIMQSAFFKLINIIPEDLAISEMKNYALKSYGSKGQAIIDMNYKAIDAGFESVNKIEVPAAWATLPDDEVIEATNSDEQYFNKIIKPIQRLEGNTLPVSAFDPRGFVPTNTSKLEKRGVATDLPCWESGNCIQCNMCAFACPHAAIRPRLMKKEDVTDKPDTLKTLPAAAEPDFEYVMQVSPMDCTGCGVCSNVCPAKQKALTMKPAAEIMEKEAENYRYVNSKPAQKSKVFKETTLKGSQFNRPYFEFSGACAGCGETPYIKVISQLFGDRMVIANATGCSSIYGGSSPTCPYVKDENGHGIAWANSLFEDNAEFGYGIRLGLKLQQDLLRTNLNTVYDNNYSTELNESIEEYLACDNVARQRELADTICDTLSKVEAKTEEEKYVIDEVVSSKNHFSNHSMWIVGGDGWAYDIGYGGLDHVLASGENVNVLVLDTEVYSNTGGQASKSTPIGAMAKFASLGKRTNKKDLAMIAMQYKNVYVAKVAMGADNNQFLKAVMEAEAYNGPSLIIAYAPCINHGIKMANSQAEEKAAVQSGYWHLFRYNPTLLDENKNPFILDSKEPTMDYDAFIRGENRYKGLLAKNPELAEELFAEAKENAKKTYELYKKLAENN
ncbi:MAG: pyruvate:ferredoxin (flavodoxin) oxidoreductase, partial [Clostridia bacterium]|nr:pyruvate:ferredoxin (flavodoxin) oxidoreductase [Clostridia bacterium]